MPSSGPATMHFVRRVYERIGTHICPYTLAEGLVWAVQNERHDLVEFVGRVDRKGCRVFRFVAPPAGRSFYALVDTEHWNCITVLPPGFRVARQGKSTIKLKDKDV